MNKDLSENELALRKLDRKDSAFKAFALIILALGTVFNIFLAIQLNRELDSARKETVVAREINTARQEKTQDYIRCLALLRFDFTPKDLSTREGTIKALDTCVTKE